MEADPTRMCELLVGLGDVELVGIDERGVDAPLVVVIRSRRPRPVCESCGSRVWSKGYRSVVLVDLPAFGRPVRLRWRKRRWMCPSLDYGVRSFIEQNATIAPERALLTSRAARWVTIQVGRLGRSVDEVAGELGCDWHTVNNEVGRWGEALLEADTDRVGTVQAVGVDETLFWRKGRWRTKQWCTSVVDVGGRQLIDIVPGRTAESAAAGFRSQPAEWRDGIRWAVLDMSGPYRTAYDRVLPNALQVADPFHVIRLANQRLDEVRRTKGPERNPGTSRPRAQQPDQTRQTGSVRVPELRELPNPGPPLRRETQLGPTRIGHSPLKSDEPVKGNFSDRDWGISMIVNIFPRTRADTWTLLRLVGC